MFCVLVEVVPKSFILFLHLWVILWIKETLDCQSGTCCTYSCSYDLDEDSNLNDELTFGETEVELLEESSKESESRTVEEEPDQSNRIIELHSQIDREWEIPADSQFEEKKLQLNCELTGPLHSCNSPMSFLSLFLNNEFLEQIVLQTNMYNTTSANAKGIVPPVEIDGVKKVLDVILYIDIE